MKHIYTLILLTLFSFNCFAIDREAYISLLEKTEAEYGIPKGTMTAISKMESGHHPWTLNVNSVPIYFNSQENLINALKQLSTRPYYFKSSDGFYNFHESYIGAYQAAMDLEESPDSISRLNLRSTDICSMQINYKWHNEKFKDVIDMTDIVSCLNVSASILKKLIKRHGYLAGVGCYHNCLKNKAPHKSYVTKFLKTLKQIAPHQYRLAMK